MTAVDPVNLHTTEERERREDKRRRDIKEALFQAVDFFSFIVKVFILTNYTYIMSNLLITDSY